MIGVILLRFLGLSGGIVTGIDSEIQVSEIKVLRIGWYRLVWRIGASEDEAEIEPLSR